MLVRFGVVTADVDIDSCAPVEIYASSSGNLFYLYSNTTNNMQRYTVAFITINAVHVSGGSSAHHQELKTVYTASGICRAFSASYRYRGWFGNQLIHGSGKKQKNLDKYRMLCVQF
jgi:hypothetical protein